MPIDLTEDDDVVISDAPAPTKSEDVTPKAAGAESEESIKAFLFDSRLDEQEEAAAAARRRAQMFYYEKDETMADAGGSQSPMESIEASGPSSTASKLPFPPRPAMHWEGRPRMKKKVAPPAFEHRRETRPARRDLVGSEFEFKVPVEAQCLPNEKLADFLPWKGNHNEDTLSEQLVKSGYHDRLVNPTAQPVTETNSARSQIWPHLKSKSTLQTMSSLLVAAIDKRQTLGRVREPSNFKPPPRVTVPDHRREAFLKELADPSLPVKRLNRGIPYGIKGKGLMEQCLSKNIPIHRAVWLAKIIGANEMRAYKRKGPTGGLAINGEAKWVREWTVQVEQFMESTMEDCSRAEWKHDMDYVIRFTCQIYSDNLIDKPHFLDWLLSSLLASDLDTLPVWLILIHIFLQDLTFTRKRGARLTETLLAHMNEATSEVNARIYLPITQRLQKLVLILADSYTGCLVLPSVWDKYKHLFHPSTIENESGETAAVFESISERNLRLAHPTLRFHDESISSPNRLLALLDSTSFPSKIQDFSSRCRSLVPDGREAALTLLRWASSTHREGNYRMYIAVRLLRLWNEEGVETDDAILAFLRSIKPSDAVDHRTVYRIVAELVRCKHFSVARYLQSLIATGAVSGPQRPPSEQPYHVRLVTELPLERLPQHVLILRDAVLSWLGLEPKKERQKAAAVQGVMAKQLRTASASSLFHETPRLLWSQHNMTTQFGLSDWLRTRVNSDVEHIEEPANAENPNASAPRAQSKINASQFYIIRRLMEDTEDFSYFADIIGITMSSRDPAVLAALGDTLLYHARTFYAIGALEPLSLQLMRAYSAVRRSRPPDRNVAAPLSELFARLAPGSPVARALQVELSRCGQRLAGAVCSPASDAMGDAQADSDEDIDRILASGTTMDEQTLQRVFAKIAGRVDAMQLADKQPLANFGRWFAVLRGFNEARFDSLLSDWVAAMAGKPGGRFLTEVFPTIAGFMCLSMTAPLACLDHGLAPLHQRNTANVGQVALGVLTVVLPTEDLCERLSVHDAYRYRLEQQKFCHEQPQELLRLVLSAVGYCAAESDAHLAGRLADVLTSTPLIATLRRLALSDLEALSATMCTETAQHNSNAAAYVKMMLDRLFDPANALGLSFEAQVARVVEAVDDMSLPFGKLELLWLLATERATTAGPGGTMRPTSEALFEAIKAAIEREDSLWPDMVAPLGPDIARTIRNHAEDKILSASNGVTTAPAPLPHDQLEAADDCLQATFERYTNVVDLTAWSIPAAGEPHASTRVTDALKTLVEQLPPTDASRFQPTRRVLPSMRSTLLRINAILHLALVHKKSFHNTDSKSSDLAAFIVLLTHMIVHPKLRAYPATIDLIFDVTMHFSDDIPDDLRAQLARAESARPYHDPQLRYLFGSFPFPDRSLALLKLPHLPPPPPPRNTPAARFPGASSRPPTPSAQFPSTPSGQHPQQNTPGMSPTVQRVNTGDQQQQQQQQMVNVPTEPRRVLFVPRYWELLPEPNGIDTAIDLRLFAARQVL